MQVRQDPPGVWGTWHPSLRLSPCLLYDICANSASTIPGPLIASKKPPLHPAPSIPTVEPPASYVYKFLLLRTQAHMMNMWLSAAPSWNYGRMPLTGDGAPSFLTLVSLFLLSAPVRQKQGDCIEKIYWHPRSNPLPFLFSPRHLR